MADATPKSTKTIEREPHDLGVPMLPSDGDEPTGPEDALGVGPKRGDYRDRIGPSSYRPHEMVADKDGNVKAEAQRPRADDIGDVPGKKGGVDSADG